MLLLMESYGDSPARIDFMLQNLEILHKQLLELDIPLVILTAGHRSEVVSTVADFIKENGVSHLLIWSTNMTNFQGTQNC